MAKKKFTNNEYLALYEEGLNDVKAAEELGVHCSTIGYRRQRLGLEPNFSWRKWTEDKVIKKLKNLADTVGRSPSVKDAQTEELCSLPYAADKIFGSWNEAKKAAELEVYSSGKGKMKDFTYLKILDILKKKNVVSVSELIDFFGITRGTASGWLRKLRRGGKVRTYVSHMCAGSGGISYRDTDFFNNDCTGKTFAYVDPVEFARFFENKILKIELDGDLDRGMKNSFTKHIKKKLPDEAVEYLREKYIKEKKDNRR